MVKFNTLLNLPIFFPPVKGSMFTTLYKQAKAQLRSVVKLNALSIGVLTFSGLYEHALTKHWSLQLGYTYTPYLYLPWTGITFRGHSITPELRYYTGKRTQALEGFYVGTFFRYCHNPLYYYNEFGTREWARGIRNSYGAGTLIGYQLLLENKPISIDFFGGLT